MKKLPVLLSFILIAINGYSQQKSSASSSELLTLKEFVERTKTKNENIKNATDVNVMVNDVLIENLNEFTIDPKNIARMEILILPKKAEDAEELKPSIIITTRIK